MDYNHIFKRGWTIVWTHKFLWALGFLAALGGGSGSSRSQSNFSTSFPSGGPGRPGIEAELERFIESLGQGEMPAVIPTMVQNILIGLAILIGCVALFTIVFYFVRLAAEGGLIHAVVEIESDRPTGFTRAMSSGWPHLLRFWGVRLLLGLPNIAAFAIFVAGAITFIYSVSSQPGQFPAGIGTMISLVLCATCVLGPYTLFISLLIPISQRGIALQDQGVLDSIRQAWELLRRQPGEILLLALIYVVVGILIAFLVGVIVLPILIATGGPLFVTAIQGDFPAAWQYVVLGMGILAAAILNSAIHAVWISYRSTTFTLAYLELAGLMPAPKGPPEI